VYSLGFARNRSAVMGSVDVVWWDVGVFGDVDTAHDVLFVDDSSDGDSCDAREDATLFWILMGGDSFSRFLFLFPPEMVSFVDMVRDS